MQTTVATTASVMRSNLLVPPWERTKVVIRSVAQSTSLQVKATPSKPGLDWGARAGAKPAQSLQRRLSVLGQVLEFLRKSFLFVSVFPWSGVPERELASHPVREQKPK